MVCLCGWGADIFLGSPQRTVLSSFSGVVLVAGSSGITFTLAALEDLVQKDTAGESRVKIIELVWIVADPGTSLPISSFPSFLKSNSVPDAR